MAIKKSEIYSRLWASCDALRGGMDASQYKDYVLAMLFLKFVSDKYAGQQRDGYEEISIPRGASFQDAVALKGSSDLGDQLNKKIFEPLAEANGLGSFANFNDGEKLGKGSEKNQRLEKLIGIFENLDLSHNHASGDDLLGDAYEYLMRNFATQSGKSKGQFYTPAEVSRVIAGIIGIVQDPTVASTTVYDPTCGSGSLLLQVADAAQRTVSLYGQERDVATRSLAKMNMVLHGFATAEIIAGNTLAAPGFLEGQRLQRFDYVVANPPFSDKEWLMGIDPENDPFGRFASGIPPRKNGDFAYLLHILASLKSAGKGVCVLPHGVLFRGNVEVEIRKWLIGQGFIKGIVGLPPNLFFGTGIPACLIVLDKGNASANRGIFMIDASAGFMKDGPKNRLAERHIHRIVDVFNRQLEIPGFSRMASHAEIADKDYNLNIPRYIEKVDKEDAQDIAGHLAGGIPRADVESLERFWAVYPSLKDELFEIERSGYFKLKTDNTRRTILDNQEYASWAKTMAERFGKWRKVWRPKLAAFKKDDEANKHDKVKLFGHGIAEGILAHYQGQPLIDAYATYQCFMDLWDEFIQDDAYIIRSAGWHSEITEETQGKKITWSCDLTPKELVAARFFRKEKEEIAAMAEKLAQTEAELADLIEEDANSDNPVLPLLDSGGAGDEGEENAKKPVVDKAEARGKIKELKNIPALREDLHILEDWDRLEKAIAKQKKEIKAKEQALDKAMRERIPKLTEDEVKTLVIDDKWLPRLDAAITGRIDAIGQSLMAHVSELAERYAVSVMELDARVKELEGKVAGHLERMGIKWQ